MRNRPDAPLFATINVTTKCNLNCQYCYMQPRSNEDMSREDFERIVDELDRLSVFLINISGGEAFVHPEIGDFLRIAHDRFEHVIVLTNGSILKSSHFAVISEIIQSKGDFTAQVSLDAIDPTVNEITRGKTLPTIKNIMRLREIGAHVIVAAVITRFNADRIPSLIEALSPFTRYFHFMSVQNIRSDHGIEKRMGLDPDKQHDLWIRIENLARDKNLIVNTPLRYDVCGGCATGAPCMAAFSHFVIDPSLLVRPCDRLTDVFIGNLRRSTISEVWNSEAVLPILNSPVPYCGVT